MADVSVNITEGLKSFEKQLLAAINKGLSSRQLKVEAENASIEEITRAVIKNQDLFRPDRGPGGGDDLVGLLGVGEGGKPLTSKIKNAWKYLLPIRNTNLSSTFRKRPRGKFGIINYEIDEKKFYNRFDSTYISRKAKDSDFVISWMSNLINGIPTEQLREYPDGVSSYVYISSSDSNFNPNSSRTGLGHMVAAEKVLIPATQFVYSGRGFQATFGKLFQEINKRLKSAKFRKNLEKRIAAIINSGG